MTPRSLYLSWLYSQSLAGQLVYSGVWFADTQSAGLQYNVKVFAEKPVHLVSQVTGIVNPVVGNCTCLVALEKVKD